MLRDEATSSATHRFAVAKGFDAVALSRFAHQIADPRLCVVGTVIIEITNDAARDPGVAATVDAAVRRLTTRGVRVVIRGAARARHCATGCPW